MAAPSPLHNIGGWPQRWGQRWGRRLAILDGRRRLDYAGLERRCAALAGWLRAVGVGRGDRVALLLDNRSAALEAVFSAARLGALSVPINTRLTSREIRFALDDCTPTAVLHESALESTLARADRDASRARLAVGAEPDAYERAIARARPVSTIEPVQADDPMLLMYTSGTTGEPKGALLPHRKTLFNNLNAHLYFGIRPGDRVLVSSPLFHSLGLLILSLPALYAGATVVLHRRFDPDRVWRAVGSQGIGYFGGVPTMYQQLLEALPRARPDPLKAGSLRFLFTAGAAVSADLVRAYADRGLTLIQGYGQTESSILCCLDPADAVRRAGSVGRPVFHSELRCVAPDSLGPNPRDWRDTAPGETGELLARGPILMLGYWQRPEASAEVLRAGWLHTGDLAERDDEGFVRLVGRRREMWISGGENVYPAEVEAAYAEHPAIREIAIVGIPDAHWGEIGRAHVVLAPGHHLDSEALLTWGRERLARFKLPRQFVTEAALPRTASGKVRKDRLRAPR